MKKPVGIIVYDDYEYIPNAYGTTRLGYLHGFQKIGMQPWLVDRGGLVDFIEGLPEPPLLWLTCDDYNCLGEQPGQYVVRGHGGAARIVWGTQPTGVCGDAGQDCGIQAGLCMVLCA